jgi:hypothetical protein
VIGGGLLVYAASRSLDFVQSTLPTDDQVLGYFALLATSGGMIGWLLVFLYRADGIIQRGTALIMTLIDFLGEAALFTMDTLYRSGENGLVGQMTSDEIRTVILGMSGLIAEGAARDLVLFKALSQIEKDSERVADEMMPEIVSQWRGNFRSAYGTADRLGLGQYQTKEPGKEEKKPERKKLTFWPFGRNTRFPLPEPETVPADLRKNGNGPKPLEENPT